MTTGDVVSHYRIVSLLGSGGMGEVYLAQDLQLDRRIALKFLNENGGSADRRRRFALEARAVAALNHPGIAVIHDIGEHEGLQFLAMEYIDGDTLSARIAGSPVPVPESLTIALQLCDALREAHEKGIIHRDLKPDNIVLTTRGQAKILDFGLAKFDAANEDADHDSTRSFDATHPGRVMGTVSYMSPEQALGRPVDRRTDLFSLGAVLYEMITGSRAFSGETAAAVYDQILNRAPKAFSEAAPGVPQDLERIVFRALEKDPELRYQTAADLLADLRRARRNLDQAGTVRNAALGVSLSRWFAGAAALALVAVFITASARLYRPAPAKPAGPLRVVPLTSYPGAESQPSFSPDGSQFAFTWTGASEDQWDIYVKVVEAGNPLRLTTDPGIDSSPAWSPDGRHIAFLRQDEDRAAFLMIPALGGIERKLSDASPYRVGLESPYVAWSPDGESLVIVDRPDANSPYRLYRMKVETGERTILSDPGRLGLGDSSPVFSPDGSRIAFVRTQSAAVQDIYDMPAAGGAPRRLTSMNRRVYALAWNPRDGRIYFSSTLGGSIRATWRMTPPSGKPERVMGVAENASFLAVSHQGNRLAFTHAQTDTNIWRYPLPGAPGQPERLISSSRQDISARYSADGKRIVFVSNRSGAWELWLADADGTHASQLTTAQGPSTGSPAWSPDGKWIAYDSRPGGNPDIFVIAAGGGKPVQLTKDASEEIVPTWSRDGKWIYFTSNRTGTLELWKMSSSGGEARRVTANGGLRAVESLDGTRIYYSKSNNTRGLWSMPAGGGEETLVLPALQPGYASYWDLGAKGIYFVERLLDGEKTVYSLNFFAFGADRAKPLLRLAKRPLNSGLALAPDGRSVLYTQVDQTDTDIMMAENLP